MPAPPPGFEPIEGQSPFNSMVGPYMSMLRDGRPVIGVHIEERHCNQSGRMHGAMVCAIFDSICARSVGRHVEEARGAWSGARLVTVSLTTDFIGTANVGDWVEATAEVQMPGRSMAFVNAVLHRGDVRIAKASGVFKVFDARS